MLGGSGCPLRCVNWCSLPLCLFAVRKPVNESDSSPLAPRMRSDAERVTLLVIAISVMVGIFLAVAYQLVSLRSQSWLLARAKKNAPLLSLAGFFVRLTALGLIVLGLRFLTNLNMVVLIIAFISVYTILSAISLYRLAKGKGKGGSSKAPTQVLL